MNSVTTVRAMSLRLAPDRVEPMVCALLGAIDVDGGATEEQLAVLAAIAANLWERPDLIPGPDPGPNRHPSPDRTRLGPLGPLGQVGHALAAGEQPALPDTALRSELARAVAVRQQHGIAGPQQALGPVALL